MEVMITLLLKIKVRKNRISEHGRHTEGIDFEKEHYD